MARTVKANVAETTSNFGNFAVFVLLQMLGETRVRLGLDEDASEIFDRALAVTGAFLAVGTSLRTGGAPFDAGSGDAAVEFRRQLLAAEPVMARMAERGVMRPPR